jgi:hypothetical protein
MKEFQIYHREIYHRDGRDVFRRCLLQHLQNTKVFTIRRLESVIEPFPKLIDSG